MIKKLILVMAIAFTAIYAEGNATKESQKVESANSAKVENLEPAYKLFEEMNLRRAYDNATNTLTQRLVAANSSFKPIEGKIKSFYKKYIGWESVKKDLAKLYSRYYTKEELEDIANFYKTKTGKKVLATMSKLSYEGQIITQNKLKPHIEELNKILKEALAKAKKEDKTVTKKDEKK